MTTNLHEACDFLRQAIGEYNAARSMSAIETAILAMHTGLEAAFRAYLQRNHHLPTDVQKALEEPRGVSFPDLVDLVGDYTDVLGADPSTRALLVSLNTTRVRIAHPLNKPPQEQIVNDGRRLAELIILFWPHLCTSGQAPKIRPVTMGMVHEATARPSLRVTPPPAQPSVAAEAQETRRAVRPRPALLQSLWRGETRPYRWLSRIVGGLIVAGLAGLVWRAAVTFARWPPPLKTTSVLLAIVTLGLAVWSGRLLWRVFRQLGARRILLLLFIVYVSVVGIRVLTGGARQPIVEETLSQMQRVASDAWRKLSGFTRSLIGAPAAFRFAYTGRSSMIDIPGVEVNSTPIEGDIIEPLVYTTLDEPTPTNSPTPVYSPIPLKPGGNAGIQVGSYVEVRGTGGKTLRARSGPGTSYEIVTRFNEGIQLLVLEGPTDADGYTWWKVRAGQDEGWCADRWLVPIK